MKLPHLYNLLGGYGFSFGLPWLDGTDQKLINMTLDQRRLDIIREVSSLRDERTLEILDLVLQSQRVLNDTSVLSSQNATAHPSLADIQVGTTPADPEFDLSEFREKVSNFDWEEEIEENLQEIKSRRR